MRTLDLTGPAHEACARVLRNSPLFHGLSSEHRAWLLERGELIQFEEYEALLQQGDPPSTLLVLVQGSASILVRQDDAMQEVGRLDAPATVGEQGLLLGKERTATVAAVGQVRALRLSADTFFQLFQHAPTFGVAVARELASRLKQASVEIVMSRAEDTSPPATEVIEHLPVEFIYRHRVLPLKVEGKRLTLGVVQDPNPSMLNAVRQALPAADLRVVRISAERFDAVMSEYGGVPAFQKGAAETPKVATTPATVTAGDPTSKYAGKKQGDAPRLNKILVRMVAEGASDLHLSGSQKPFWRIDGVIHELKDARALGAEEVYDLCEPAMSQLTHEIFDKHHDADYAYATPDGNRYRVNMYREHGGISAVFRAIPNKLMTPQDLGLPPVIQQFCHLPKGLILVTGPTGSGKTTTLAAMIDYVNANASKHIITLEDPIEFLHPSKRCLVNQREIGPHARSFKRSLRAALREDPDIVLVGEMRDLETVALALETAATGHLVFGTMHTATAGQTLERIVGMFPPEQQNRIRQTAAEAVRGVVCQTLCKRIGGGRVAAFEILVANNAVAALLREGKTHQLETAMTTGRKHGNLILNDDLARLVMQGKVDVNEAMSKTVDREELAKRLDPKFLTALNAVNL